MTVAESESLQPLIVPAQPLRDLLEARLIPDAQPFHSPGDGLPPRDSLVRALRPSARRGIEPLDPRHHRRIVFRIGLDQQPPHLGGNGVGGEAHRRLLVRVRREPAERERPAVEHDRARTERRLPVEVEADGDQRHGDAAAFRRERHAAAPVRSATSRPVEWLTPSGKRQTALPPASAASTAAKVSLLRDGSTPWSRRR